MLTNMPSPHIVQGLSPSSSALVHLADDPLAPPSIQPPGLPGTPLEFSPSNNRFASPPLLGDEPCRAPNQSHLPCACSIRCLQWIQQPASPILAWSSSSEMDWMPSGLRLNRMWAPNSHLNSQHFQPSSSVQIQPGLLIFVADCSFQAFRIARLSRGGVHQIWSSIFRFQLLDSFHGSALLPT